MLWFQAIQFTDPLARMQRARGEKATQNLNSNSSLKEAISKKRGNQHIESGKLKSHK